MVDIDDIRHWYAVKAYYKVAAFGVLLVGTMAEEYNRICVRMHGVRTIRLQGELSKLGEISLNPPSRDIANNEEKRLRLALAMAINTSKVGPLGAETAFHLALLSGGGNFATRGLVDDVASGVHDGVEWIQDTASNAFNGAMGAVSGAWNSIFHSLDKDPRDLPSILLGEPVSNLGGLSSVPRPLDEPRGAEPASATLGEVAMGILVAALTAAAASIITMLAVKLVDLIGDALGLSEADKDRAKAETDDLLAAAEPTDGFQPGAASGESLRDLNAMLDAMTGQSSLPRSPSAENLAAQSAAATHPQSAEPSGASIVLPAIASALAFKVF